MRRSGLFQDPILSDGLGFAFCGPIIFASPIGFDLAVDFPRIMTTHLVKISRRIPKTISLKFRLFSNIWNTVQDV